MVNNFYRSTSDVDNPVQQSSTCTEIQCNHAKIMDEGNALVFSRRARRLRGYVRGVVSHSLVEMVAEVEVRMVVLWGHPL